MILLGVEVSSRPLGLPEEAGGPCVIRVLLSRLFRYGEKQEQPKTIRGRGNSLFTADPRGDVPGCPKAHVLFPLFIGEFGRDEDLFP